MNNEQLLFYNKGFNDCLRKVIDTNLVKTLTDKEITQIVSEKLETWNTKESMIEFARAILRKAQEK